MTDAVGTCFMERGFAIVSGVRLGFPQSHARVRMVDRNSHGFFPMAVASVNHGLTRRSITNQHPLFAKSIFEIADELVRGIDGRGHSTRRGV
jgi:hypothetical protein